MKSYLLNAYEMYTKYLFSISRNSITSAILFYLFYYSVNYLNTVNLSSFYMKFAIVIINEAYMKYVTSIRVFVCVIAETKKKLFITI